jgi:hypothetical protein
MKTVMKIFMVAVISVFASFAMAETVSVLPFSKKCSAQLLPLLKKSGITFNELRTQSGALKFSRANKKISLLSIKYGQLVKKNLH